MRTEKAECDLCVIGGGMAGICAAVSAARKGLSVILIQDRNVLGGNASGEIRMWIRGAGAAFPEYKEGGLIEELALDNMYYNPALNYSLWDAVLYNKVVMEKNIRLLLGTTCIGATCENNKITGVRAWQLASYVTYEIKADYFADCSGDCILAEFTDAETMQGRESKHDFNESSAPETADKSTMGNSCLLQLRQSENEIPHRPFPFEKKIDKKHYKNRIDHRNFNYKTENFWWLELGGNRDALYDADEINKELLALSFGSYSDYLENTDATRGLTLDWAGFLAGKRETRRYKGDYVLTVEDIKNAAPFKDEIAYGGWSIDDHNPDGFYATSPNVYHRLSQPYPIPFRCVYSKNIENLFFAGRNISVTHLALSSTRVMATCAMLGQTVGFAAYLAKKHAVSPRKVGTEHIKQLQEILLDNDCFLLHTKRINTLGIDTPERELENKSNKLILEKNRRIEFTFPETYCEKIRMVFDSNFARDDADEFALKLYPALCYNSCGKTRLDVPKTMVKDYVLEFRAEGKWEKISKKDNFLRLVFHDVGRRIDGIAFTGFKTYGADKVNLFSIDKI